MMPIPSIMTLEKSAERRREDRWRVHLGACWLDARPYAQALTVIDLSASGFLIEVGQALPVGTCIIVELPQGMSKICRTVWSSGNYHGAQFSEPLSAAELEILLSQPATLAVTWEQDYASDPGQPSPEELNHRANDSVDRLSYTTCDWLIAGATAVLWAVLSLEVWAAAS